MKKLGLSLFIIFLAFLLAVPNCTKTITEYETVTDTLLIKPTWSLQGSWEWGKFPDGEDDYTKALCWAIMRNITDVDHRYMEIVNPRIGILAFDNRYPWKSFEKGVSDDLGILLDKEPNYTPIPALGPGEYGYMYEILTLPSILSLGIHYIGLSDEETPPGNLGKIAIGMGKPPSLEEIEQIKQKLAQE